MRRTNFKNGFTLAETIMVLAIVGVVVTASLPLFTSHKNAAAVNEPWAPCGNGRGLCTERVIADDAENADRGSSLTISDENVKTPFDFITSDIANYTVGAYNFSHVGSNLRIDTEPVTTGTFPNNNVNNNILIGTNAVPEPADPASTANGNVIIGNNTTVTTGNNNVIIGDGNRSEFDNSVLIGRNLQATANSPIAIGNNNSNIGFDNTNININPAAGVTLSDGGLTVTGGIYSDMTATPYTPPVLSSSDERLKNIKGSYNKGLKEVLKLEPVIFTYKKDKTKTKHYGLIAQDVQKVFPEAVHKLPDGHLGIDNDPIFFAMLNAVKEIDKATEEENTKNIELQKRLKELLSEEPVCNSITCKIKYLFEDVENWFKKQIDKLAYIKENKDEV